MLWNNITIIFGITETFTKRKTKSFQVMYLCVERVTQRRKKWKLIKVTKNLFAWFNCATHFLISFKIDKLWLEYSTVILLLRHQFSARSVWLLLFISQFSLMFGEKDVVWLKCRLHIHRRRKTWDFVLPHRKEEVSVHLILLLDDWNKRNLESERNKCFE